MDVQSTWFWWIPYKNHMTRKTKANKKSKNAPPPKAAGRTSGKKKKSRNSGGSRRAIKGHPLFGNDAMTVSNTSSVPIAFDTLTGNTTFISSPKSISHKTWGYDGIVLHGCQPFSDIGTTGADTNMFLTGTLAGANVNSIIVSPDYLNGPVAAQSNLYERFVFRDIIIEYTATVATTQAGAFSMSVHADGSLTTVPTSFSTVRQVLPSMTVPFRHDKAYLHYHYGGPELFYNAIDSTSVASFRQTNQCTVVCFPSAASSGAITYGYTNIWYVLELYCPTSSQGFTVSVNKEERDLVAAYLRRLRLDKDDDVISVSSSISRGGGVARRA